MYHEKETEAEALVSEYKLKITPILEGLLSTSEVANAAYSVSRPTPHEQRDAARLEYDNFYGQFVEATTLLFKNVGGEIAYNALKEAFDFENGRRRSLTKTLPESKKNLLILDLLIKSTEK